MAIGLQFNTHITSYTVPEFVGLAKRAHDLGFQKLWLNDNARYRSVFVVLTAIAAEVPIKIGTATLVPYFHQPLELAVKIASLTELCPDRELSLGIAVGDLGQTQAFVKFENRLALLRETTLFLKRSLSGEMLHLREFPRLVDYFKLNEAGRFQIAFTPSAPVSFYCGALGPKSLTLAGKTMEGVVFPGQFLACLRSGRLTSMLNQALASAATVGKSNDFRFTALVNVSILPDRTKAREFARPQVAHSIISLKALLTPEEFAALGVDSERVDRLDDLFASGATIEEAAKLVDDKMIDAYYLAGTPDEVAEAALQLARELSALGIHDIAFSKLGPDYGEALNLLGAEVLPKL